MSECPPSGSPTPPVVALVVLGGRRRGKRGSARVLGWFTGREQRAAVGFTMLGFFLLFALLGPILFTIDPMAQDLASALAAPTATHPLGTDDLGRDLLSRLIHGSRVTIGITAAAATLGMVVGSTLGLLAAYFRAWLEIILMRLVDTLLSFPGILLALSVTAVLGFGIINIIIAMAVYSIPLFARFAYATTLSVKALDYVEAARALGATHFQIMRRHVVPNILPQVIIVWTIRLGSVVLVVSGLSFLGVGVQPPYPEWGAMLSQGRTYLRLAPWLVMLPGIAISLLVLTFNILGDGLRDILDPRMRAS